MALFMEAWKNMAKSSSGIFSVKKSMAIAVLLF